MTTAAPGDDVFGIADGSFARTHARARADKLAPKPRRLTFEQAAAVPVSGLAAHAGRARPGTAAVFGAIWAGLVLASGMIAIIGLGTVADLADADPVRAQPVWSAIDSVQNGLGGGNEIVGGLWVLLISWAALDTGALPRGLNYLGVVAGVAGLVTVVPALEPVGAIFGLGLIVWFAWAGIVMLGGDSRGQQRNLATERER